MIKDCPFYLKLDKLELLLPQVFLLPIILLINSFGSLGSSSSTNIKWFSLFFNSSGWHTTWIFLLWYKDEVLLHIKWFFSLIKNQFAALVKTYRSDNGSEFIKSSLVVLFTQMGISHQTSCIYTPQHNGVVERTLKHLLGVARALKLEALLPDKYWGFCAHVYCYLINVMLSYVINGIFLYESL